MKEKSYQMFKQYTSEELKDIDMKDIVKYLANIDSLLESCIDDKDEISWQIVEIELDIGLRFF